jgi:hypothetical protein
MTYVSSNLVSILQLSAFMKTLIIVSKCQRVIKLNQYENTYYFHFKGVYSGDLLKQVVLSGRKDFDIRKNEEYLMYVQMLILQDGILRGKILKCKPLDQCWDRS